MEAWERRGLRAWLFGLYGCLRAASQLSCRQVAFWFTLFRESSGMVGYPAGGAQFNFSGSHAVIPLFMAADSDAPH